MILLEAHKLRRERHSSRAAREKFPRPLSDRRRAPGNAIAAEESAIGHHHPAQDHDRLDVHRGKAAPAGRPHPGEDGQESDRPARLDHPDQSRRERGHADSRQIQPAARSAGARFPQRRPGDFRAPAQAAGRHPARHRPDRLRQDDDALRLPQLHQQTRPQDHHRRGSGRVSDDRHQPGAGECRHRHDLSRPRSARSCARRRTSS